eukprot:TRINITY_DN57238_c0_g1_i1.p1 TRINITY_DN57238_c0_g1~~TRINITY_DN57238_c0_g1_i1.p1  ORF type:complete len:273 (+),score=48.51 TRINITY_DN57238_c0_g1_i1:98-916(+)
MDYLNREQLIASSPGSSNGVLPTVDSNAETMPSISSFDMSRKPQIMYAIITRGAEHIVADHVGVDVESGKPIFSGNFRTFTSQLLPRLDATVAWKTYVINEHAFHYIIDSSTGFWFICLSEATMGRRVPFAFLSEIQERFKQRGFKFEHPTAATDSIHIQKQFQDEMQTLMTKFNDPGEDRVSRMIDKVKSISDNVMENIDKIRERQEKIELLVERSEALREESSSFRTAARQVRRKVWWQSARFMVLVVFIVLAFILVCVMAECGVTFKEC